MKSFKRLCKESYSSSSRLGTLLKVKSTCYFIQGLRNRPVFPSSPPPINYAVQGSHAFDFRICSATLESLLGNWDWRGLLRLRHFFFFVLHREFIIDSLSVERNHVLVRVGVVGGPSERKLPARALQEVSCAQNFLSQNWWLPKLIWGYFHFIFHVFFF